MSNEYICGLLAFMVIGICILLARKINAKMDAHPCCDCERWVPDRSLYSYPERAVCQVKEFKWNIKHQILVWKKNPAKIKQHLDEKEVTTYKYESCGNFCEKGK